MALGQNITDDKAGPGASQDGAADIRAVLGTCYVQA